MTSTSKDFILEALAKVAPLDIRSAESVAQWAQHEGTKAIVCLTFGYAASNVASFLHLASLLEESSQPLLLHGERCATHCVHLVKAHCVAASRLARMLYSASRLVAGNRTVDGLREGIFAHVRLHLEIRVGRPPNNDSLRHAPQTILGTDGDDSLLVSGLEQEKQTPWFKALLSMVENCNFDRDSGKWLFFTPSRTGLDLAKTEREAVQMIAEPLCQVLVHRRWETAALSRWTGVLDCLKRLAIGIAMNGVLPTALGNLPSRLGITDQKLEIEKQSVQQKAA